jgi:uncharacterized membrane protein YbaN (DUF454 family)
MDRQLCGRCVDMVLASPTALRRSLWLAVGLCATALGIAGAALPLLPTTPFLLVAVFAFARSSPRLHGWLLKHPSLGPSIEAWSKHGAIPRRAKRAAAVLMVTALVLTVGVGAPAWLVSGQAAALAAAASFIFSRPDAPQDRN